jgi:hypothetical protein
MFIFLGGGKEIPKTPETPPTPRMARQDGTARHRGFQAAPLTVECGGDAEAAVVCTNARGDRVNVSGRGLTGNP